MLGIFLMVWSRGGPRMFGAGFLAVGAAVVAGLALAVQRGVLMAGVNVIMDVIAPGLVYFLAVAIGAVLAVVPFILVAVRL